MKRIKDSFAGVLTGIGLLIAGIILLFWNEGNNVNNIKTVDELSSNYIDIANSPVDTANEGKLVALNGKMNIADAALTDSDFGIEVKTAKLNRIVEMYQWEEREENDNNKTNYTYEGVWRDSRIDSSNYHDLSHNNPEMPYECREICASNISVGDFKLSADQIHSMEAFDALSLDSAKTYKEGYNVKSGSENQYITNAVDLENPKIGDIRIRYEYSNYDEVSIMAVQKGNSFEDYVSKVGKKTNKVVPGARDGSGVISYIIDENNTMKWVLRLVGALAVILGISLLFGPISTLASFVPILGGIVGFGVFLISLLSGLSLSLIVIAIAWLFYRPLLGIILLAAAALLVILVVLFIKKRKKKKAAATA